MKLQLEKGTTDITINIFIQDSTASDGSGKTSLAYTDMTGYYIRPAASPVSISFADQTPTGAHTENGFILIDDANLPGLYRFDLPDAALITGVDSVIFMLTATDAAPVLIEIQLVDRTGYSLSSTGLDSILVTEPAGRASTFREMVVQLWMRFFNKVDKTSSQIRVYDEDGNTNTTQSYIETSTINTVNKAT